MSVWFCLASGPSMCAEDAEAVRGRGRLIAIGNTGELAPFADVLYSADGAWWRHYGDRHAGFTGRRCALEQSHLPNGVEGLPYRNAPGLGLDIIHTGQNSGYQAINLAFLEGARTIVLVGYDMQHTGGRHHWHPDHPRPLGNFNPGMPELCRPKFDGLARDLAERGVRVINASRETALTCFERIPLRDVLAQLP
jgi:hypothetical protein